MCTGQCKDHYCSTGRRHGLQIRHIMSNATMDVGSHNARMDKKRKKVGEMSNNAQDVRLGGMRM